MKSFKKSYTDYKNFIYCDPCDDSELDLSNEDFDIVDELDKISIQDREVALESENYSAIGFESCGEIVQIYDVELKY